MNASMIIVPSFSVHFYITSHYAAIVENYIPLSRMLNCR